MTTCFTPEQINKINNLVKQIEELTDVEKLFLYLQLPSGLAGTVDEIEGNRSKSSNLILRLNGNIFTRKLDQETTQTYTWILSHLEVDQNVSLPKQEVYDEYKSFCQANKFEPLCVADFGKAMKHTFPCIKPRRLGHRGNSRYCYSGLRKKYKITAPSWPEITDDFAPSGATESTASHPVTQIPHNVSGNSASLMLDNKPEQDRHKEETAHNNKNGMESLRVPVNQKQCVDPQQNKVFVTQEPEIAPNGQGLNSEGNNSPIVNSLGSVGRADEPVFSCNQTYFSYSYPQSVHQPDSPDDDDYQHNYQHTEESLMRQFVSKPSPATTTTTGVICNHLWQQQQHHQSNVHENIVRVDYSSRAQPANSATTMLSTSTSANQQMPHDPMLPQTNFCLDSQGPSSSSSTSTNTMSTYMSLSRLNGAPHIDSYASPFQSPASTPYPSISSNYMNHDSQDYFSCDLMQHYTSS